MTGASMVRLLKQLGWRVTRIRGSHHHLVRGGDTIIVPVHGKKELARGLEAAILKKAGLR